MDSFRNASQEATESPMLTGFNNNVTTSPSDPDIFFNIQRFCASFILFAFCCVNLKVECEQMVIAELMYHPKGSGPEFIEFYNQTATPLDMASWQLRGGVAFDFPPFDANDPHQAFFKPWERCVISSTSPGETRQHYGIPDSVRVFGPWSGTLSDSRDSIILKDKNQVELVRLDYRDDRHWPAEADGLGHSLVLRTGDGQVNDWRSWRASQRPGGTPGTEPISLTPSPRTSPEVDLAQGVVLLDFADTWRFNDANRDLGISWREEGFNDNRWEEGQGLFGFESSSLPKPGIQTPLNDENQLTYYFRTTFSFQGNAANASLSLDTILDDAAVFYLNGQEVGRVRMPQGKVSFDTAATGNAVTNAQLEESILNPRGSLLRQGRNTLAVEVHQINRTSSDVVFGARLRMNMASSNSVVINEVLPLSGNNGFIEFYNPLLEEVDLQGFHLSDNPSQLNKKRIEQSLTLSPGGLGLLRFDAIGLKPRPDLTLYLSTPDGKKPVSAIHAPVTQDGRSIGRMPDGGNEWFVFSNPTPEGVNGNDPATMEVYLNELHYAEEGILAWVELWNKGTHPIPSNSLMVALGNKFEEATQVKETIPAGTYLRVPIDAKVSKGRHTVSLINQQHAVLNAHRFNQSGQGFGWQAYPDGSREWYAGMQSTPQSPNAPQVQSHIVINEIMYDPPSNSTRGEFIELLNQGDENMDLSGWRFAEGVDFVFPTGTVVKAGAYLVIAGNLDHFLATYDAVAALGNFEGQLSNNGERLRLEDQWGNLVDEVDYRAGGEWPELPNGGGSSLELVHPRANNLMGSAWNASVESDKTAWKTFRYRDQFKQFRSFGNSTDYKEIFFHLVSSGHVMMKDISLRRLKDGVNLIKNGQQMSPDQLSAKGWLAQGTHWQSHIDSEEHLHIISDGRGDNRPNRVEIDVTGIRRNDECEISFQARWISGRPRLIFSTWDHSIANSFVIPIPEKLGTPGRRNSTLETSAPPQVAALLHAPPVPNAGDSVTISADIASAEPMAYVRVYHRRDSASSNTGTWNVVDMHDDGLRGGDLASNDGRYSGLLKTNRSNRTIVQFYVEARTVSGKITRLPRNAPEKPALYVVDNRDPEGDLRSLRFVVSAFDMGAISNGATQRYDYKFPRLSNHYFNATFISNEKDIYYNAMIRNTGSPWTRGGNLDRAKFKVPADRPFRGRVKHRWDNDASNSGRRHHNRITRYMLYLLGHPVNENEFVNIVINSGSPRLGEDTEPVGNAFLDRNFESGSDGELYRIDDEWWFRDNWERQHRDASWDYKDSDNPGRYRTEWMKRTRESEDDFSALIHLFRTASSSYDQDEIEKLVDPEAVMKMFVVRGYIDDWDSISLRRGKNGYMYRRADDGKFQFLQWDSDLTFGNASASFYQGLPQVNTYIRKPYNLRLFYYYLTELLEKYTHESPRMTAWLEEEERASRDYTINERTYTNWFRSRETKGTSLMQRYNNRPLEVTTSGGIDFETNQDTLVLKGSSSPGIFEVRIKGQPQTVFQRDKHVEWTLSGLRLREGNNTLVLEGVDQWGETRETTQINITKSNNADPVLILETNPSSWNVSQGNTLRLDAGNSFDPENDPLLFDWTSSQEQLEPSSTSPDKISVTFQAPGWYPLSVTARDASGKETSRTLEASVYGRHGFSGFNTRNLDPWWSIRTGRMADNRPEGSWFSLEEKPGHLTMRMTADQERKWDLLPIRYPYMSRSLPQSTDWSLHAKLKLDTGMSEHAWAGITVSMEEADQMVRYGLGFEGGDRIVARKLTSGGSVTEIPLPPDNPDNPEIPDNPGNPDIPGNIRLSEGLVALWNFDNQDFQDSVGDFHGEARGKAPIRFTEGPNGFGNALKLDGVDQFVEITGGAPADLGFEGESMSLSAWFRIGGFDKGWQALAAKGEGNRWRVHRRGGEAGMAHAGGIGEGPAGPDVSQDEWHHVVAITDADATEFATRLYIDGKVYSENTGQPSLGENGKRVMIGGNPDTGNRTWRGDIDDLALWNRPLSEAEVATIFATGPIREDGAILPLNGIPAEGSGLDGRYWQAGVKAIDNLEDKGGEKDIGLSIINGTPPTGVFRATQLTYTGSNDLTPVREWLQHDGDSYTGAQGNMDDGIMSFTGYLRINNPGEMSFRSESDDGSILWIAGTKVVDNDGGHGAPGPTPDGNYNFETTGLYPIEIAYYNGDWTNDSGQHGGANLNVLADGNPIPGDLLYGKADLTRSAFTTRAAVTLANSNSDPMNTSASAKALRIRRSGDNLHFESGRKGIWNTLASSSLQDNATANEGGLFMSSTEAIDATVHVDYAMLVDPSQSSDLLLALRPTEIMYHPMDPTTVEFIELTNVGDVAVDLAGGRFIEGIQYTFGPTLLQPGAHIVIAGQRQAFLDFYGMLGGRLADGSFEGRLADEGERITFVDADGNVVFSLDYDDSGKWPDQADGKGSSLQAVSARGDASDPAHWVASSEIHGSPGQRGRQNPIGVVINEVLTHTDPPFEDAIELYNTTATTIDIGMWFLSDNINNLQKYQIPAGTLIEPGGFYVAYQSAFFNFNPRVPFALSSAFGDEVYLTMGDAQGNVVEFVDGIAFPAAENGRSMGRYPNGSGPVRTLEYQTLGTRISNTDPAETLDLFVQGKGAPNAEPFVGTVVINRIMYHPTEGNDEFIELRNRVKTIVSLFDPRIPEHTWQVRGGIEFNFPPDLQMRPGGRILITASDPEIFRNKYQIAEAIQILGPYTRKLNNLGETIRLLRPDAPLDPPDPDAGFVPYLHVDEVTYGSSLPWPLEANGFGDGLQRVRLEKDGSNPGNWSSFSPGGETIGDRDEDGMKDTWEVAYGLDPDNPEDAFSDPDGDGFFNLDEFLALTHPLDAQSALRVERFELMDRGMRASLGFRAQPGLTYIIEATSAIQSDAWTEISRTLPTNTSQDLNWDISITDPIQNFFRLRVLIEE